MSYNYNDIQKIINTIKSVKFAAFPGGAKDVSVSNQLPNHAFEEIAKTLIDNGIGVLYTVQKHGHWLCSYDRMMGTTDVTCSCCGDTRTINGCYVTTQGDSCYSEDYRCPVCDAIMDERV